MISFRNVSDPADTGDRKSLEDARLLFYSAFPYEPEGFDRIERWLRRRAELDFEPILLCALDRRKNVIGLSFVFYFPEIRFGYLQYIASDPQRAARGIGGAVYEATRELLTARGAKGLLLDVPPDDPAILQDPERLKTNRSRNAFYERYGARVVQGTLWDREANPRNAYYLTQLMFDPLERVPKLHRADARKAVTRILEAQYGYDRRDAFVKKIIGSFREEPLSLRTAQAPDQPERARSTKRIRPIKVVVADGHVIHHLKEKGYVERPVRVRQIMRGLEPVGIERVPVKHFPDKAFAAIHDPKLIAYLKAVCARLSEKSIVYPEVFPIRRPDRAPQALEDRAGYFCADTFTPLTRNVWPAARQAVDVALTAAELVRDGERFAYAVCRPPGHHAERRIYGGFCFLNNSAAAAHFLSQGGNRVALLDIDYHHGNGAQDIFYKRADVLTLSIHGHPRHSYPNFSGYADERGESAGIGYNRNWPLAAPVDDDRYLKILGDALGTIGKFKPRYLVVSLGFDIMKGDPTGSFSITTQGLRRIAKAIADLRLPTVLVQEGGYAVRNLRIGARAFFETLSASWYETAPPPGGTLQSEKKTVISTSGLAADASLANRVRSGTEAALTIRTRVVRQPHYFSRFRCPPLRGIRAADNSPRPQLSPPDAHRRCAATSGA